LIVNPTWGLEEKIKEIAAYLYTLEKDKKDKKS